MRNIEFTPKSFEEFQQWVETDKKMAIRIGDLIRDSIRDPFKGIGKPEPLRYDFAGFWSRRIDDEHRLVYKVTPTAIVIFSCHSHYNK